jgi:hypothetical protein
MKINIKLGNRLIEKNKPLRLTTCILFPQFMKNKVIPVFSNNNNMKKIIELTIASSGT